LVASEAGTAAVLNTSAPLPGGIRISRFLKDLALTTVTSVATIAALLLTTKILAGRLGPEGFGAYMLARRVLATLDPVSTFSMAIALTRFAALAGDDDQRRRVLVAGTLLAVAAGTLFCAAALSAPALVAKMLFTDARYAGLVSATGCLILAYSAFIVLYAWYRGTDRMGLANLWQLWAIAFGPLLVAWAVAAPGKEAAVVMGSAVLLAMAGVPMASWLVWALRGEQPLDRHVLRAMVRYAGPRVPGGLAFGGLLAVGPVIAPHVASLAAVGYVAAGQALLRVVEGATEAFGRVALPKIAQLSAAGEGVILRERVADVTAVVVHIGLYATLHLWLWAPELVRLWLGDRYEGAIPAVRYVVLGILPYLLFVTLRSVLDALEERAVNATNLYIAIGVTAVAAILLGRRFEAEGLALATSVGLTVLGILTVRALRRTCAFPLQPVLVRNVVLVNAVLAAVAVVARLAGQRTGVPALVNGVVVEAILVTAYGAALWQLDARWMRELRRRVEVGPA
jgi:O-antigen/teichoic acid export membrane protein